MQTFDQSLVQLYRNGLVARDDAVAHADAVSEMRFSLDRADLERERAAPVAAPVAATGLRPGATPGAQSPSVGRADSNARASIGVRASSTRSSSGPGRSCGDQGVRLGLGGLDGRDGRHGRRPRRRAATAPRRRRCGAGSVVDARGACGATRRGGGRGAARPQPRLRGATVEQVPPARRRHAVGVRVAEHRPRRDRGVEIGSSHTRHSPRVEREHRDRGLAAAES